MDLGRLYFFCGSLCFGLALPLICGAHVLFIGVPLLCAFLAILAFAVTQKTACLTIVLSLLALTIGCVRADFFLYSEAQQTLQTQIGVQETFRGKVIEDPDRRESSLHLTVAVTEAGDMPVTGTLMAMVPRDEEVLYGDEVEVTGTLKKPATFETDFGHTFDYPNYLRAHGVTALLSRADVRVISRPKFTFLGPLYTLRHWFESSLERQYTEPDGSLMEGILLGEKHGIPQSLTSVFIQSGLVHVVVLSGYNIAVVASAVYRTLSFLPRVFGIVVGGILMTLFALMTGAGAATVRALLMALIALFARALRRPTIALRALVVAAASMALWSPLSLLYDTGFILSVLATFGLITLSPFVEKKLPKLLRKNAIVCEIATTTIAVQLFTLPALLYFSGVLSFTSVPANVLALPVIPYAMLGGFLAGLLGLVSLTLGFVPAFVSDLLLRWFLLVADVSAHLPWGSIVVSEFPEWVLVLVYIPLTWFAVTVYQKYPQSQSR